MKSEKIKTQPETRSVREIESQKLAEPGGKENVYDEFSDAFYKAVEIVAAGLGEVETGLDARNVPYFKLTFKDKVTSKDFEFYTIYKGQVDLLKAAVKNRR